MTLDAKTLHTQTATPVAGLLAMLRMMAERFAQEYGAPEIFARFGDVYGPMRRRVLGWLHEMECVARRMLVLRAAQFPPQPGDPRPLPARKSNNAGGRARFELFPSADDPAQWRVQFRVCPPGVVQAQPVGADIYAAYFEKLEKRGRRVESRDAARAQPPVLKLCFPDDARPLAMRFEALRRVLNNPDLYAARLMLRLHRSKNRYGLLQALCAKTMIVNAAGLDDADWDYVGETRELALSLLPYFAKPDTS